MKKEKKFREGKHYIYKEISVQGPHHIFAYFLIVLYLLVVYGLNFNSPIVDTIEYISHASGGIIINGKRFSYTNSQEGILLHHSKGQKKFEVDLVLSPEGNIVFGHGYEDYLRIQADDRFTSITVDFMFQFLADNEETCFILDIKDDGDNFEKICRKLIERIETEKLDRLKEQIIMYIFNESQYSLLENLYGFNSYYFGAYANHFRIPNLGWFKARPKVEVIVDNKLSLTNQLIFWAHTIGVKVYTYNSDTKEERDFFINRGVDGFIIDFPPQLNFAF